MPALPNKKKLPNFHMVITAVPKSKINYFMKKININNHCKKNYLSLESVFTAFVNSSN